MLPLVIALLLQASDPAAAQPREPDQPADAAQPAEPAPAQPAEPAPAKPPVITNPEWAAQPSEADIAKAYPGAGGLVSAGYVTLACRVTGDGGLAPCEVVSEAPGYVGFGSAALKLSSKYRMKPTTEDGRYVAGAVVLLAIQFPRR
jgi:periplasmic protein TonB